MLNSLADNPAKGAYFKSWCALKVLNLQPFLYINISCSEYKTPGCRVLSVCVFMEISFKKSNSKCPIAFVKSIVARHTIVLYHIHSANTGEFRYTVNVFLPFSQSNLYHKMKKVLLKLYFMNTKLKKR